MTAHWTNCYDGNWQGVIVPEAFAHPAKFAYGLIKRIIAHGLHCGYWAPGDVIGDPFGGVGLGGICAAYAGLGWVGVELEPRFHALAQRNFELHRRKWEVLGAPQPVILQGDSRRFAELVGQVQAVVGSPPFVASLNNGADHERMREKYPSWGLNADGSNRMAKSVGQDYGTTAGQIGSLPAGEIDAVVTSPPYAESEGSPSGGRLQKLSGGTLSSAAQKQFKMDANYGQTAGQIGSLPAGEVDAVVTSPPYVSGGHHPDQTGAWNQNGGGQGMTQDEANYGTTPGQIGRCPAGEVDAVVTSPPYNKPFSQDHNGSHGGGRANGTAPSSEPGAFVTYGQSPGQIEGTTPETYWQAVAQVYRQCWLALKPGGIMVLVVKDYVKNKARVPLCDQTCELLSRLGFKVSERTHCHLVKETEHPDLFDGSTTKRTERKSFFRRLAEKKGSPRIDWEEVIWARKEQRCE